MMHLKDVTTAELMAEVNRRVYCDSELVAGWETFKCIEKLVPGETHRHRDGVSDPCFWCGGMEMHSPDCDFMDKDEEPAYADIEWTDAGLDGRVWLILNDDMATRRKLDLTERTEVRFLIKVPYVNPDRPEWSGMVYASEVRYHPVRAVQVVADRRKARKFTSESSAEFFLYGFPEHAVQQIERIPA